MLGYMLWYGLGYRLGYRLGYGSGYRLGYGLGYRLGYGNNRIHKNFDGYTLNHTLAYTLTYTLTCTVYTHLLHYNYRALKIMSTSGVRYGLWYGFRYNKTHKSFEDIFEVPCVSKFSALRSSVWEPKKTHNEHDFINYRHDNDNELRSACSSIMYITARRCDCFIMFNVALIWHHKLDNCKTEKRNIQNIMCT